ncbi:MAG: hypothetical protein ABIO79_16435 [Ferruginibacter sp.]
MKYRVLIKGITLVSFVALISLFLLYRMGKFNSYFVEEEPAFQTSHNGGKIVSTTPESDSAWQLRLASSKSMVLIERSAINPSVKGAQVRTTRTTTPDRTGKERMSSSKSMVMVDYLNYDPFTIDQKKRAYLSGMLIYRFTYFQDSLRKISKPLPLSFQKMIDSMKFTYNSINWFDFK